MIFIETITRAQAIELLNGLYDGGAVVHYFNGAQWNIAISESLVITIDTSLDEDMPQIKTGDGAKSYLESGSNMSKELDENGRQIEFAKQLVYFNER
jgi:hypothetical protein